MIKGVRIQATNSIAIGAYSAGIMSAVPLLTLPTGKTFVLTDIVCGFTPSHAITGTGAVVPGIALLDVGAAGNTAADMDNAKFIKRLTAIQLHNTAGSNAAIVYPMMPLVVTDIEAGPEFSTCLSAIGIGTWPVPTYGLYVGGVLR